jgi:hypothetical protein
MGTLGAVSPGVKWPGREANHLHPSSAEINNSGAALPLRYMTSWRAA